MLSKILKEIQKGSSLMPVRIVKDGSPDWRVLDNKLSNSTSDYFSVCAIELEDNSFRLILQQDEEALVLLICAWRNGAREFLLQIRSEPGLLGSTVVTSTVQSTLSNILRKHRGKNVPYVSYAYAKHNTEFIHDSVQYDWGDYYLGKKKRFVVIEVHENIEVNANFLWVPEYILLKLVHIDHLVSTDLLVCISMLMGKQINLGNWQNELGLVKRASQLEESQVHHSSINRIIDINCLSFVDDGLQIYKDSHGNRISFYEIIDSNREIATWVQPLFETNGDWRVRLYRCLDPTEVFAVYRGPTLGIREVELWSTAQPISPISCTATRVTIQAEGGRFYHQQVVLELMSIKSESVVAGTEWPKGTVWMERSQVQKLIMSSLATTLELRLAWTLLIGDKGG